MASGPGEEENVAPGSFVKDAKFQSFVEALVSSLTARVSSGVDGRDAGMGDTNNEENDEMEMDGPDAEVERFEKNKSKSGFTEQPMECLASSVSSKMLPPRTCTPRFTASPSNILRSASRGKPESPHFECSEVCSPPLNHHQTSEEKNITTSFCEFRAKR